MNSPISDKWAHFLAFAGLSFSWLCIPKKIKPKHYLFVIIFGPLLGYFIELLQISPITSGRSFEVNDIIADGIGTIIGIIIFYGFYKYIIQPFPSHHQQ